jgi:2-dehydropantoate 2-reductase
MKIGIIGPGGIGSTFAFQLSKAGHDVTVVARGKRLEQLYKDMAIVSETGNRASVQVSAELDSATAWEIVLVTVLASQVDAVLPALVNSKAKTVMFMFNTFESLDRLRNAVGSARFAMGFPAILASLKDGKLTSKIYNRGLLTTVTNAASAKVFTDAGIPTVVYTDMESWLRTKAAATVPVMLVSAIAYTRQAGVSWSEAMNLAHATNEGFRLVRHLGNTITPTPMAVLSGLPTPMLAALLWTLSRLTPIREVGVIGIGEASTLIDQMSAAAPGKIPTLLALRERMVT